jgi:hypothetical protein
MKFARARAVADAVLFEGYALYPYRPTAVKNQLRWQFGVLAPRGAAADPWWLETQLLVAGAPQVDARLRFLRLRRRTLLSPVGAELASLEHDGRLLLPWDEGELCEQDFTFVPGQPAAFELVLDGDTADEPLYQGGALTACVRHARAPILLRVLVEGEPIDRFIKLRVRVENQSTCAPNTPRDRALMSAALSTHLLFAVERGEFVSIFDPPDDAIAAAARCRGFGSWPVLAGEPGRHDLVLSAPIILYDHPAVAPESPQDLFDATEIDEILTLRTQLLTDEEKRQARATDPKVAQLIDRACALTPEAQWRLHGALRDLLAIGSRVRLRPGPRRTDAQDLLLVGRTATVRAIQHDVDGRACLAVTIDDDPAAELKAANGRHHYFYADEVEPIDTAPAATTPST